MATAAAKTTEADTATPENSVTVHPLSVTINVDGFAYRDIFVRLPEGATADCLKSPDIWKRVQSAKAKSLRALDRLYIAAFDDSWVAEAIVCNSDGVKAILSRPRITALETGRFDNLFQDDKYRLKWDGAGYFVERKNDKSRMSQSFPNTTLAQQALLRLYPKVA
jgi:hypothetical protein